MADRVVAQWVVDVARTPAEVYDYLADVSRHHEWSPKPFRVEGIGAGAVSQGATYTSYGWIPGDKEHRNEVDVTTAEAPTRLVLTAKEPGGEVFVNTFTVAASGGGSTVRREMDMPKPGGFVGAIFPVFLRGVIRPSVQKGMNAFKRNLESGSSTG